MSQLSPYGMQLAWLGTKRRALMRRPGKRPGEDC